ncbi:MAG: tetratricopeptide repeat protein [Candidatus Dependentiae bacterium]|nr:tetratricopeptide repeat protein [Candidatus Dependentiae bacterium]
MGILTGMLLVGVFGKAAAAWWRKSSTKLENFDEIIGKIDNPILAEAKLRELSNQAQKLSNNSIYLQILSQIALMQAMQKNFEQAHATLDQAFIQLQQTDYIATARILLERGRVFQQAGDIDQARKYFEESYQLSKLHHLDDHVMKAAHMIAIVAPTLDE